MHGHAQKSQLSLGDDDMQKIQFLEEKRIKFYNEICMHYIPTRCNSCKQTREDLSDKRFSIE